MRQIFDGFMDAHNWAQSESKKTAKKLTLCKREISGVKYSVIDEEETKAKDEVPLQQYNEKGEIV